MHSHGLVFKYLSPDHIKVTKGWEMKDYKIKLKIADIAIMQLIDHKVSVNFDEKMCGINHIFIAPEIINNPSE